jgi:radical SAM superfamily enzyme YgiQ (UPF0313 family)
MSQQRVALIVPPYDIPALSADATDPPIGIASIAGYLESKGIEVLLVDALAEKLSAEAVIGRLEEHRIRFVGITCNYCTYHKSTLSLSKKIKERIGDAVVFAGGNHATSLAAELLAEARGSIDCVVCGEGEITAHELIERITERDAWPLIKGLSFISGGKAIRTPDRPLIADLDGLPLPAYHLLPMKLYQRYNIVSARGCPFGCDFCASTVLFTRKVRYRSPANVFREIRLLVEQYGDRKVWFSDDTFTVNREHTEALLDEIIREDLKINWSCLTTVNTVELGLLQKMRSAGCRYVSYGVESGHPEFLKKYIKKPINRQGIIRTSEMTHEAGLDHYGFFIFGFPGESWETVYDTYDLILKSRFSGGGVNILIPLPGTSLWRELFGQRKLFTYAEIDWENLFARGTANQYSPYVAGLASRWCSLSDTEIIEACKTGERMFPLSKHMRLLPDAKG